MIFSCRSPWLVKTATACLLASLANNVHAAFQFYSVETAPVVLTDSLPETFNYTFIAIFNSHCTDECEGYQDYILGLSAFKNSLEVGDLPLFMEETVSITASDSGDSRTPKELTLGAYKGTWQPDGDEQPQPLLTATYSVTLKKAGLEKLFQNGASPGFYIRGADVEGEQSYDNYYVKIPLEKPPMVTIVRLDDVVIDTSFPTGDYYYEKQSFCVYSSENPHTFRLSIKTENNQRDSFYLAPDKAAGADNAYLPYSVAFVSRSPSRTHWVDSQGEYPATFTGGKDKSCSTDNMQVRARVMTGSADKVPVSVYEDYMYVIVEPQ